MASIEEVREAARLWAAQQERARAQKRKENRINYTDRAKEYIAAGRHPVTGLPLLGYRQATKGYQCSRAVTSIGKAAQWK